MNMLKKPMTPHQIYEPNLISDNLIFLGDY